MPRLTAKSQLEGLSDFWLDAIGMIAGGWAEGAKDADDHWIDWWPPPWNPWRWFIQDTLGTPCPFQLYLCDDAVLAAELANRVGLDVDEAWGPRQIVIESIWKWDQEAAS